MSLRSTLSFGLAFLAFTLALSRAQQPSLKEGSANPPEMKAAKAAAVGEREIVTRLQIFLDQKCFGPGIIDGRWGEFTGKALGRYAKVHGLTPDASIYEKLGLDAIDPIYTTHEITEAEAQAIGEVPKKPVEQAKLKRIPYSSLLEFIEERYHASPDFLRKLNPEKNMDALKAGDVVWVPNVEPLKVEEVAEIASLPERPEYANRRIVVDTKQKMLDLFDGDTLLVSFPITPGSSKLPAPPGDWKIVGIATLPWFRHDESVLNTGVRSDDFHNIPSGPNNPVGLVWIGLSKPGIGIHGTNTPETIGRSGSHGCIRLANWDAIRLAYMVSKKMKVTILD